MSKGKDKCVAQGGQPERSGATSQHPQNPGAKKRKHTRARSAEAAQRGWYEQGVHEVRGSKGVFWVWLNWLGNCVIRQHQTSPIANKANALTDIYFAYFDISLGFLGNANRCLFPTRKQSFLTGFTEFSGF